MPGIKQVIETFCERFKKTRLLLSFPSYGHDLLDVDDGPRLMVEEADISRICGEYFALPWYPSKEYHEGEDEPTEASDLVRLTAFDTYYVDYQKTMAEAEKMEQEAARTHRKSFTDGVKQRYPLLNHLDLFACRTAVEELPKAVDRKTLIAAVSHIGQFGDCPGPAYIESKKQCETRRKTEERKSLEESARSLAEKMGCEIGSMKFIKGLHRLLGRHRDRRQGLREDGLCATAYPGTMAGFEQWSEMDQDIQSDIAKVHRIVDWLKTHCPLLWCQYQERRRERKAK